MDSIMIGLGWVLLSGGAIALATVRRAPGVGHPAPEQIGAADAASGESNSPSRARQQSIAVALGLVYGALLLSGFAYLAWSQARQFLNH